MNQRWTCNVIMFYLCRVIHPRIKAPSYLINPYNTARSQVHGKNDPLVSERESLRPRTVKGLVEGHIKWVSNGASNILSTLLYFTIKLPTTSIRVLCCWFLVFLFCSLTETCYVVQDGLKLGYVASASLQLEVSLLFSLSAGITGIYATTPSSCFSLQNPF